MLRRLRSLLLLAVCGICLSGCVSQTMPDGPATFTVLHSDYQWRKTRNLYFEDHPVCEMCGIDKDVQVHHVKPWHLNPDLRYDLDNLISLCQPCHFRFGHGRNWKAYNANVKELADYVSEFLEENVVYPED